jgi:hypothetical protein
MLAKGKANKADGTVLQVSRRVREGRVTVNSALAIRGEVQLAFTGSEALLEYRG